MRFGAARPWWLFAAVAAVLLAVHSRSGGYSWHYFVTGSRFLFSSHGLTLYAVHPELQIGPVALLIGAPFVLLLGGRPGEFAAMGAMLVIGFLVLRQLHLLDPQRHRSGGVKFLLLGIMIIVTWFELAVRWGHLDDALAIGLAVGALRAISTRHWLLASVLLAAAADSKPWAVAFVPLLLLAPRREWLKNIALWSATVGVAWAPFVLAAPRTLAAERFVIVNAADSALRAIGFTDAVTPSWCRAAQFGLGALATVMLVRRERWMASILVVVAIRLLIDPSTKSYYDSGLMVGAGLADLAIGVGIIPWCALSVLTLVYLPHYVLPGLPEVRGLLRALCLTTLVLILLFQEGAGLIRRRRPPRRPPTGAGPSTADVAVPVLGTSGGAVAQL